MHAGPSYTVLNGQLVIFSYLIYFIENQLLIFNEVHERYMPMYTFNFDYFKHENNNVETCLLSLHRNQSVSNSRSQRVTKIT